MRRLGTILAAALLLASRAAVTKAGATLPTGFQDTTVFSGLTEPTAVRFASDGRVFVAEKSGLIKVFDSLTDVVPIVFADLRTEVDDYWDRGLLGLALHPDFPSTPYVYVLYSYDFDPVTGTGPPAWNDDCPNPPGATTNGCTISARLSRLTASGDHMTGTEQVLVESWGQQFPSHSIGDLHFDADGALYVSGGEGASFNNVDYGQYGSPKNPLGDPPSGKGGTQTPPTAEGGALRAQSLLRIEGGPALPSGSVLRLSSDDVLLNDPLAGSGTEIAQRIIAYGLRNPFRFTIQPTTGAVWIGDVGWTQWEEINRVADPLGGARNFGWPCYEGSDPQPAYVGANLAICDSLYATPGATTSPVYAYPHSGKVVPGETCPIGSSSITGLAFYGGNGYPVSYRNALFFGDYSRRCIWVMFPDASGAPDPTQLLNFVTGAATPVDLEIEPSSGDLFYVDLAGGTIRRIQYFAPTAVASATPTSGGIPLMVQFDGSGSLPAQPGDTLSYAWDLDGDGNFNDGAVAKPTFTYSVSGSYQARLRVTDNHGISSVSDPITISAGNSFPTAFIDTPSSSLTWKVGDAISFSGHATDPQQGTLPASALTWNVLLHHCPSTCHIHPIQTIPGVASGSFAAPDHEYPSWLELQLTATDSAGLSSSQSVILNPQTTTLTYQSSPTGLVLVSGTRIASTPFTDTVIVGSQKTIVAASPQTLGGIPYGFRSWSDGGAASHSIVAVSPATYVATFAAADLSLAADAAPAKVCPGDTITWTLTASNAGPSPATTVAIAATLPAGTTLQSWSGDGWSCSGSATVTCTRARIDVGPAPGLTLSVKVGMPPGDLPLAASISAATSDPNSANNSKSVTVLLGCVPFVQAVSPASGPAAGATSLTVSGDNFQPGISVTIGGVPATDVVVTGPTALTASAPTLPAGTLNDLSTHNPGGDSGMLARAYLADFFDVPATYTYHGAISKIFRAGITTGCGAGNYCPEQPVTRGEMAVFLLRGEHTSAYHPPTAKGDVFDDVPLGTPFGAWIEQLAAEGITNGCGGGNYCPDASVTRDAMAKFLLLAKHGASYQPPEATGNVFDDVPLGAFLGKWIEELAAEGITSGCGPRLYCPNAVVSRGEMAVFLSRTFSLP